MTRENRKKVRVGLIQMACGIDPEENLKKAMGRITQAALKGAKIISLPELFRTRYFCQTENPRHFALAESIPGKSTEILCKLAKKLRVVIVAPLFEKAKRGVYHNAAVVIDADGSVAGTYRKMHIPYDAGFYEKFYFKKGNLGFKSFKTRYARIGVLICYDQWFPEAARLVALSGAQIIFYPTAIGWKINREDEARDYREAWETVQRGHAIANGIYTATVNRVGKEGAFWFWGDSFVADSFGRIKRRASCRKEEVVIVDCNFSEMNKTRREWPFFRDRRVDAY